MWRTLVAPLPLKGVAAAPPRLVFAVPLDELLTEARRIARDSAATTAAVLGAALVLALFAARAIARPLNSLVGEANAIRRFEFSRPVQVESLVKEVDELAGTMDEMKRSIRRFLDMSTALAAEPDLDRLLARLLDETIAASGRAGRRAPSRFGRRTDAHPGGSADRGERGRCRDAAADRPRAGGVGASGEGSDRRRRRARVPGRAR